MQKELRNSDGTVDMLVITSDDNYQVKLDKNYTLVGYAGNKMYDKFKNSILGADIGIKSNGFVSMILLSTLLAISVLVIMYFSFRI